jgi:hypothetical protein
MKATSRIAVIALACIVLIGVAGAVPTTGSATLVGSNNATIDCSGVVSTWWVQWGETEEMYWKSSDQTSGTSYRIHNSPLFGRTTFYYSCCDATGCGATSTFKTLDVTPIPTQHIGIVYENITENGYDLPMLAANLIQPLVWNPDMPVTILFMLVFSPIFIGIWLRSRTVLVALIFGFIVGSFVLYSNAGLGLGMPPEVVALAQAICYIAFAGCVLYVVHR